MNIDMNKVTFRISMSLTGIYALNADSNLLLQYDHITENYDDFTESANISSTCIRQINLLASYNSSEDDPICDDTCSEDEEPTDIGRMSAVIVFPALIENDRDRLMQEIEYVFELSEIKCRIEPEELPQTPFLIIKETDFEISLDHHEIIDLYALMVDIIDRFICDNFGIDITKVYCYRDILNQLLGINS